MKRQYALFFRIGCIAVVVLTLALRLYKINAPIADWHSFRQVDTASVAKIFLARGIDLLHPRYHDLSNIQSGKDNPQGWRMVELPLYQAASVLVVKAFPSISLEVALRLVSILAAAGTALLLMLLMRELTSPGTAIIAGLVYAVMPYSIFYGRAVLPETFAVFWAMLSVYLTFRVSAKQSVMWGTLLLAAVSAGVSVLVKPTAGFLLLPVPYLLLKRRILGLSTLVSLVIFGVISLVPLLWWRNWITRYPEGIPVFDWLLNKGEIRFKGAWFQWLFAERIAKLMFGFWGIVPLALGFIVPRQKKEGWTLPLLAVGGFSYLSIFAAGNVQHDYYQIILIPILCLFAAKGYTLLVSGTAFSRTAGVALAAVSTLFFVAFSWYTIRTYYWINRPEIITAGTDADRLLPKDAKVIAPYNGDTTFLYQTGRSGWPLGFDIDEKIAMGATHYVTVSPTDSDWETKTLAETYTVLVRNDRYAIIDLTKPKMPKKVSNE